MVITTLCREGKAQFILEETTSLPEASSHESVQAAISNRTGELSSHTRSHPHDVVAWLEYVDHQQDAVQATGARAHLLLPVQVTPCAPSQRARRCSVVASICTIDLSHITHLNDFDLIFICHQTSCCQQVDLGDCLIG